MGQVLFCGTRNLFLKTLHQELNVLYSGCRVVLHRAVESRTTASHLVSASTPDMYVHLCGSCAVCDDRHRGMS